MTRLAPSESAAELPRAPPEAAHLFWVSRLRRAIIDAVPRRLDPYREFGDWLRATRDAIGMSQKDLSVKMGRPVSFIGKIETAQRRLDIIEFGELAEALGVAPPKLYDRYIRTRK